MMEMVTVEKLLELSNIAEDQFEVELLQLIASQQDQISEMQQIIIDLIKEKQPDLVLKLIDKWKIK